MRRFASLRLKPPIRSFAASLGAGVKSVLLGFCVLGTASVAVAQNRVVSTDAAITAVVVALGAQSQLVGVDASSELPAAIAKLPRLGYHRALSAEGLMSLNPDLVLASEHAGPETAIAPLASAGARVLRLPAADSFSELLANIHHISVALGRQDEGRLLAEQAQRQRDELATRALKAPGALLVREGEGGLRVAGTGTAGAALLSLIGARNLASFQGYRRFSPEALLALNPQVLLVAMPSAEADGGAQALERWLARYPLLRYSEAVARGQWHAVASETLLGGVSMTALAQASSVLERLGAAQGVSP